ncbi:hypothetical protein D918_06855, partial [Trichuris suis]
MTTGVKPAFVIFLLFLYLRDSFQKASDYESSSDSSSSSEEEIADALTDYGINPTRELVTLILHYKKVGRNCTIQCKKYEKQLKRKINGTSTNDWATQMASLHSLYEEYINCGKRCMKI